MTTSFILSSILDDWVTRTLVAMATWLVDSSVLYTVSDAGTTHESPYN